MSNSDRNAAHDARGDSQLVEDEQIHNNRKSTTVGTNMNYNNNSSSSSNNNNNDNDNKNVDRKGKNEKGDNNFSWIRSSNKNNNNNNNNNESRSTRTQMVDSNNQKDSDSKCRPRCKSESHHLAQVFEEEASPIEYPISASCPDDIDVNWLRIEMDLDGHDVVANVRLARRDSTEEAPISIEPFSRPRHERRLSLAGSEEVF